jgi:dCMP deaminase
MKTQKDWDQFYLNIAKLVAQQSYAEDRKVGAVIVKDDNIISFSYNGTPRGWNNETQNLDGQTKSMVLHAETQAIAKVSRSTLSSNGATLYSTLSPCIDCAKLIYQVGIKRLVYIDTYKCTDGIQFLKDNNVMVNEEYSTTKLANQEWLARTGLLW